MAFTSWAALKTAILNDLADGSVRTKSYTGADGRTHTFQDLSQIRDFIAFCDMMALAEGGARENYVRFGRPTS